MRKKDTKNQQDGIQEIGAYENIESVDDINLEDIESLEQDKLLTLKKKLKTCEKEKIQHLEDLMRAKADFLNSKKRLEVEKINDRKHSRIDFIYNLLPLCDSFYMAMNNTDLWQKTDKVWREGVELIYTQLLEVMKTYDVSIINPIHEKFDPNKHEASGNKQVDDIKQHNYVQTVLQMGFTMRTPNSEELIRPAKVIVGEFKEK